MLWNGNYGVGVVALTLFLMIACRDSYPRMFGFLPVSPTPCLCGGVFGCCPAALGSDLQFCHSFLSITNQSDGFNIGCD